MERLTERFMHGLGVKDCYDSCSVCDVAGCCGLLEDILEKLAHYEDLEEQLEKLYGGKMSLNEVVENLNRIVQNGEEKLDYARILTNAEAEKWDKWKDLEKQGRLIELPCAVGDTVYWISESDACLFCNSPCYERCEEGALKIKEIPFKPHMLNEIGEIIFFYQRRSRSKAKGNRGCGVMDDYCYECTGYGDDYYYDEELDDYVCACDDCPHNDSNWEDGWWRDDI